MVQLFGTMAVKLVKLRPEGKLIRMEPQRRWHGYFGSRPVLHLKSNIKLLLGIVHKWSHGQWRGEGLGWFCDDNILTFVLISMTRTGGISSCKIVFILHKYNTFAHIVIILHQVKPAWFDCFDLLLFLSFLSFFFSLSLFFFFLFLQHKPLSTVNEPINYTWY